MAFKTCFTNLEHDLIESDSCSGSEKCTDRLEDADEAVRVVEVEDSEGSASLLKVGIR